MRGREASKRLGWVDGPGLSGGGLSGDPAVKRRGRGGCHVLTPVAC